MADRAASASATAPARVPVEVSFEFFPPRTAEMEAVLWRSVERLAPLKPRMVSVTYGADGSTRDRTHRIVGRIVRETGLVCAPHLTCVGSTREQVQAIGQSYWAEGIRHLVALRGDPPEGTLRYEPHPGGYAYAVDLVRGLRDIADFDISVAAYPEVHPEAPSAGFDLDNLKRKLDAGAKRAITQFFFDVEDFLRFRDRCRTVGLQTALVPGILPISRFSQTLKFADRCGACIPNWLRERFAGLDDDPQTCQLIAANLAIDQVNRLRQHGVQEFHFYTLNRAELTYAICHALGLRAEIAEQPS